MTGTPRPVAVWIATVGAAGHFPVAPGTVGSAVGVMLFVMLRAAQATVIAEAGVVVLLFAVGCWASTRAEVYFKVEDPSPVVIDEVVGQLMTLAFMPLSWFGMLVGFLTFRVLDILKPFPARQFERLHGGLGIMADDAMAGIYGYVLVRAAAWLLPTWMLA